jgi:hypothetical protein
MKLNPGICRDIALSLYARPASEGTPAHTAHVRAMFASRAPA